MFHAQTSILVNLIVVKLSIIGNSVLTFLGCPVVRFGGTLEEIKPKHSRTSLSTPEPQIVARKPTEVARENVRKIKTYNKTPRRLNIERSILLFYSFIGIRGRVRGRPAHPSPLHLYRNTDRPYSLNRLLKAMLNSIAQYRIGFSNCCLICFGVVVFYFSSKNLPNSTPKQSQTPPAIPLQIF